MKRVMAVILFGAVMLQGATLIGNDFRVDLLVEKNICGLKFIGASEGLRGKKATWLKENADSRLLIIGKAGETWEEKSFQFTADEDCEVNIHLLAEWAADKRLRLWIAYDNIRIEGATVENGSFEDVDTKSGLPENWGTEGKKNHYVLKKGDDAADGDNYIEVSHDNRAVQKLKCKKGELVTVTFMVRDVKRTPEQK